MKINTKKELRNKYKLLRDNIADKDIKSDIIFEKIINLDIYKKANKIAIYYSLDMEVDTKNIIDKILLDNKTVLLPKTRQNEILKFYELPTTNYLISSKCGGKLNLIEPNEKCNLANDSLIDLIIVPGICFDEERNRIGFGKGYYDKFLENKNIYKIAICFDEQVINKIEKIEDHDVKMDLILTDKRMI